MSYQAGSDLVFTASPGRDFVARRGFLGIPFAERLGLPREAIESYFALPSDAEIEVVMPGERARRGGGDYLYVVPADSCHRHDRWFVRMRPARGGVKERWSTCCRIDELDRAKAKYLACLSKLRAHHLNRVSPTARPVADVLTEFVALSSHRHHVLGKISGGYLASVFYSVERLIRWIGDMHVGDVDKFTSARWMEWAKGAMPGGGGYSHNTAFADVYMLRAALEAVLNTDDVLYRAPFEMPAEAPTSNEAFTPGDIARVPVAAETGRIWDAGTGDWKRDGDGAYVLRRTEIARAARPYGRFFLLGVWFGSRTKVNLNLSWTDNGGPWIDLDRKLLHRLGKNEEESAKRRGFCDIPDTIVPILRAWRDEDLAHGCDRVLHTWDYGPIAETCYQVWYGLLEAAGAQRLNPHCLKHTCVWILKLEEVPLASAADYLFTWPHTLVKRYGPDWDARSTSRAAQAIGSMKLFNERYRDEAVRKALVAAGAPAPANDDDPVVEMTA
ncbi:hypothetical protein GJ654_20345 [Rhodoblastus acidophilus]|uniref:Uncharacterized protein n=1 Tax=Rhodoblastus acidophilus TaxID=1074 RepID=A0A6N8DRY3_RHOAC|nr:hypothetical protein [Rhodoblastus acidophilus]MCW2276533.1 integrase [Rhodoblastus acidophilus]MTV33330.1 hypothetical protein [Rhodoblastus acidophilus]